MTTPTQIEVELAAVKVHIVDNEFGIMTTPTQAQIEAATTPDWQLIAALRGYAQWIDNYRLEPSKYMKVNISCSLLIQAADRIAALTAAARIEEQGLTLKYTDKDLYDERAATIERCAQVAESFNNSNTQYPRLIAAAIRKLKDE